MTVEAISYLKLFGGLVYLLMGGDLLVRGAIGLSHRTRISPLLTGLTIVAAGTSAPELMVSMHSALSGFSAIALGNVVGSNVANVLLVIGVPALISPLVCREPGMASQALFMLGTSILFVGLCWLGPLELGDGLLLLGLLVTGALLALRGHFQMPGIDPEEAREQLEAVLGIPESRRLIGFFAGLGIVMLPLGADLAVEGAVEIARSLEVGEAVIGASLIAIGTSLPELSTTVVAACHGSSEVALGNVIGSNVLNVLAILGATALVTTIPIEPALLRYDVWVMLASSAALTFCVVRRWTIGRKTGGVMLAAYGIYLVSLFQCVS